MSTEPTTELSNPAGSTAERLDLTVLEALDFEPSCESHWHTKYGWPAESATHVMRRQCACGTPICLLGAACVEKLAADRAVNRVYRCRTCGTRGFATSVTLDPL